MNCDCLEFSANSLFLSEFGSTMNEITCLETVLKKTNRMQDNTSRRDKNLVL